MIVLMKMLVMYKYVYYIYIQLITLIMFDSFPCLSQFLTDCWLKILLYTPNESQTIIPFVSPMNSQFLFQTYGFVDSYPLII